jgi:hypothetical protein
MTAFARQKTNCERDGLIAMDPRATMICEDYEQLAQRCVKLADECSVPDVAHALRALALDYLARAASLRPRD